MADRQRALAEAGELDASEIEPVDGENAVTWHSGTTGSEFTASTASFSPLVLPTQGANLTPGWHTIDVVYTKGYFAVYYDGHEFTSYSSANVTGAPLNVYFTAVNSPDTSAVENAIGGPPVNSANAPSTDARSKYLRIRTWPDQPWPAPRPREGNEQRPPRLTSAGGPHRHRGTWSSPGS